MNYPNLKELDTFDPERAKQLRELWPKLKEHASPDDPEWTLRGTLEYMRTHPGLPAPMALETVRSLNRGRR